MWGLKLREFALRKKVVYQTFKVELARFYTLFSPKKIKEERTLLCSLYEISITLSKPDTYKKIKLQIISLINIGANIFNKILAKQIQ